MMAGHPDIDVQEIGGHVSLLEVRRPPNNYLDTDLLDALSSEAEREVAAGTRAIVVASQGKHFSAGVRHDSSEPRASDAGQRFAAAALSIFRIRVPTVGAIQGAAVGGGLGLACAMDFRVAGERARFVPNFTQLGMHPGFGLTHTLPRLIGPRRAASCLMMGDAIRSDDALALGLCDRVVDDGDCRNEAIRLARTLAERAPLAVASVRMALRKDLLSKLPSVMTEELTEQSRLRETNDFQEGVKAVAERRLGDFRGS